MKDLFQPTLVRASAGSGKTFALSNRFLALLAEGERPERILATTFTRKAAGEIQERVYQRLASAALDQKAADALGEFIGKSKFSCADAQAILKRLTESQARLNICTLDSFFISVAQSFSFEMGLVPGWVLADSVTDTHQLRSAVAALCKNADAKTLASLLSLINKGNTKTSIHSQLEREISELYSAWRITDKNAWNWLEVPNGLSEGELAALSQKISELPLPRTKKGEGDVDSLWKSSIERTLESIKGKRWDGLIESGLVAKLLTNEEKFNRHPIENAVRKTFQPLLQHLKAVILGKLRAQTEASFTFLSLYAKEYDAVRLSAQNLNFEGVKHALAQAQIMGELSELYYRLDTRIAHLLLDEFQDTSRDEWLVLQPMVAEILSKTSKENSFFCVGDTKQAIYGWRGGAAQIFETLEEGFPILRQALERKDESRRSAPEIINTVNQTYGSLSSVAPLQEYPEVLEAWQGRFTAHTTALKNEKGYVELRAVAESAEESDIEEDCIDAAANYIEELHRKAPRASIGVLMRGNSAVALMLAKLWDRNIKASGEGGNPLTDSRQVCLILAALRLSEHPGDTISAFLIANSELGKHLELADFRNIRTVEEIGLQVRSAILVQGLGELLRTWVSVLSPKASAHDCRRMRQLVEMAYGFNLGRAGRLGEFISVVELTHVENPAASRVRVMTIHKSKGLEFDAVVLADLAGRIPKSQPGTILTYQPDPIAAPVYISRYADKFVRTLHPQLSKMYEQEKSREIEEALSVLYVALTRARTQLSMFIPAKASKSLSFAEILRQTLAPSAGEGEVLYSCGEKDVLLNKTWPDEISSKSSGDASPLVKLAPSKLGRRRGLLREVSTQGLSTLVDLAEQMRLESEQSALRTVTLRRLLRAVEWLDTRTPDVEDLADDAGVALEDNATAKNILEECKAFLSSPDILKLLSKPKSGNEVTYSILTELPFAFRNDAEILSGNIPRLVIERKNEKPASAHVVVFDFGMPNENRGKKIPDSIEFRPQLKAYVTAAAKFTGLAESKISATIAFLSTGKTLAFEELKR